MKRDRSPDVADPVPKRARGSPPAAGYRYVNEDTFAHDLHPKMRVDLTGSCRGAGKRGADDDDDDDDFCEIVSEVMVASSLAGGSGAHGRPANGRVVYDLTSEPTEDSSSSFSSFLEVVGDEDDDASTAVTSAAGPSTAAAASAAGPSAPAVAAAAAAATVAAAIAASHRKAPRQHLQAAEAAATAAAAAAAGPSNAGAGPSSPCPGCLVDDKDAVQRYNMQVAVLQLSPDVSVTQMAQPDPNRDPRAAVVTGGARCCADCRRLAALAVVEAAQKQVQSIVGVHRKAAIQAMQGFTFEVHHAASFNIAAIRAGSLLRAECMEFNNADIRVYNVTDPRVTLAMAQLKASGNREYLRKLNKRKYAHLLKVVPSGFELPVAGWKSVLSCQGISSSPISLSALEWAVLMPGDHFFDLAWAAA